MINSAILFLENTANKFGNKTAIDDSYNRYTFREVRKHAIELACSILSKTNSSINEPIAVYLPKSAEGIICFMGALYSGNFYVPLDIKTPKERLEKILENLKPRIIFTNLEYKEKLLKSVDVGNASILLIEEIFHKTEVNEKLCLAQIDRIIDTDPIYGMYTSGSTGTPKGVVVSHRGVIDYMNWLNYQFEIDEKTIIGNQAPFYFDNSTFDIHLCMSTGATLIIVPEQIFAFPPKLIQFVDEKLINLIFWVPSVLNSVSNADVLNHIIPSSLKKIFFAGEVMPNKHLNYWRRNIPEAQYVNMYGPTEITDVCTYYIVDREFEDDEPLPIGYPCRNTDIIILNDRDERAQIGEMGELCVRGSSLAMGYWRDSEKTQAAFIQNPLNRRYPEIIYRTGDLVILNEKQEIMYIGRKDTQIKHMGFRIELGEIENVVLSISGVDNACVLYNEGKQQITLFYETKNQDIQDATIRAALMDKVPKYMIPTKSYRFEKLPYNANGKIDRVKLRTEYIGK